MGQAVFNIQLKSDLRDSDGNQLIIAGLESITGTYPKGGVVLEPEDFGLTNILNMTTQSGVAFGSGIGGDPTIMDLLVIYVCTKVYDDWKMICFFRGLDNDAPVYKEMDDGSPLAIPEGFALQFTVIGN